VRIPARIVFAFAAVVSASGVFAAGVREDFVQRMRRILGACG
jgi:hypothetical protein